MGNHATKVNAYTQTDMSTKTTANMSTQTTAYDTAVVAEEASAPNVHPVYVLAAPQNAYAPPSDLVCAQQCRAIAISTGQRCRKKPIKGGMYCGIHAR